MIEGKQASRILDNQFVWTETTLINPYLVADRYADKIQLNPHKEPEEVKLATDSIETLRSDVQKEVDNIRKAYRSDIERIKPQLAQMEAEDEEEANRHKDRIASMFINNPSGLEQALITYRANQKSRRDEWETSQRKAIKTKHVGSLMALEVNTIRKLNKIRSNYIAATVENLGHDYYHHESWSRYYLANYETVKERHKLRNHPFKEDNT